MIWIHACSTVSYTLINGNNMIEIPTKTEEQKRKNQKYKDLEVKRITTKVQA